MCRETECSHEPEKGVAEQELHRSRADKFRITGRIKMASEKYYVGVRAGNPREVFLSASEPTSESHGKEYGAVIGPFESARGADFMARYGEGNPHCQTVEDAERLAALEPVGVETEALGATLFMLKRLTEKVARANGIQHSGGRVTAEDWSELRALTNESSAVIEAAENLALPSAKEDTVIPVPRSLLVSLIDMANTQVEDITSGIEEGIYETSENPDIGEKSEAVKTAQALYRESLLAEHPEIHIEQARDGKWTFRHDDNEDEPDAEYFAVGEYASRAEAIDAAFGEYGVERTTKRLAGRP